MYTTKLEDASGGEKSQLLARLLKQGFPVPPGFVVTAEAAAQATQGFPDFVLTSLKDAYDELSMGKDLKEITGQALDMISVGRQAFVAVRGNGNALLNVRGIPQLQAALKELWAHARGEVIVQKMVDTEKTGVITSQGGSLVIEANWGLALEEDPDLYVIRDGRVRTVIGSKEWQSVRDQLTERTIRQHVLHDKRGESCLSEENVRQVYALYNQVTEFLQEPVKLTFAVERHKIHIVQVVPVRSPGESLDVPADATLVGEGAVITPGTVRGRLRMVTPETMDSIETGDIVLAQRFSPALQRPTVSGLLLEYGSVFSLGKEIDVPCMRIFSRDQLKDGQEVLLNAIDGQVLGLPQPVQPAPGQYQEPAPYQEPSPQPVPVQQPSPQVTSDVKVLLSSPNQHIPDADGVVVRGEALIVEGMHPSLRVTQQPDEVSRVLEQRLESLARQVFPKQVWYVAFEGRTDELQDLEGAEDREPNPVMGWRGLKRSLDDAVFRQELLALERVYQKGVNNIVLILPFVSSVREVQAAKQLVTFPLKLGVSIDTPAAALQVDELCKEGLFGLQVDVDSLTQLVLGVDADNPRHARYFSSLQPVVRTLVERIAETGEQYHVPLAYRGVIAQRTQELPGTRVVSVDDLPSGPYPPTAPGYGE